MGLKSQVETCCDCKRELPVIAGFSARHGHCQKHEKRDHRCDECRSLRHSSKRQPRCRECNRLRCKRYYRVTKMKALVVEHGLTKEAIKNTNGSCAEVVVTGLLQAPNSTGLWNELAEIAGDLVTLRRDGALTPIRSPHQRNLSPYLHEARPEGPAGATFARFIDLHCAAGPFQTPSLPEPAGWLDVGVPVPGDQFVVGVKGNSMETLIPDGSHCLFEETELDHHLQNQVVLAHALDEFEQAGEGQFTVKRLRFLRGRRSGFVLLPENEIYEPIEVRRGDRVIVLALYRRRVDVA